MRLIELKGRYPLDKTVHVKAGEHPTVECIELFRCVLDQLLTKAVYNMI